MSLRELKGRELQLLAELGGLKLREEQVRLRLADAQGAIRALEAAAGAPPSGAPDAPEGAQGDGHVKDE
jgi:hypothetical protein